MVDMGDVRKAFESQIKTIRGGKIMEETETVQVTDMTRLYARLQNYRKELLSLADKLTDPRRNVDPWQQTCWQRRYDKLHNELIPSLKVMLSSA
jgi:predicted transcriptional regulator